MFIDSYIAEALAVASLIYVAYYIVSAVHLSIWGPLSHLPGPIWSNFTSLPDTYHSLFKEDRAFWIHELHERYGSQVIRTTPFSVSVTGLDAVKKIYGIGSKPYSKWSGYSKFLKVLGPEVESISSLQDMASNAKRRKIYAHQFTRQGLVNWTERIETCMNHYGQEIETRRQRSGQDVVDVLEPIRKASLDVITDVAYGGAWKGSNTDTDIAKLLDSCFPSVLLLCNAKPLYNLLLRVPLKSLAWVHDISTLIKLSEDSLDAYKQTQQSSGSEKPNEFMGDILYTPDPNTGAPLTYREQVLETLSMLIAGVETTTASAAFAAWEIAKHPHVVARLQHELDELLPEISLDSGINVTDVKDKAVWLNACLKEAMRINPAGPGQQPRVTPREGAELGSYTLPGNTVVFVQSYTVHRDPTIFPEPDVFKPERWLSETREMSWAYVTFSQGPRLCLGYNLAWMELRSMLAFLFRNYNVSCAPGASMEPADRFILHSKSGDCRLRLEKRI